jgi:hypothetical protein
MSLHFILRGMSRGYQESGAYRSGQTRPRTSLPSSDAGPRAGYPSGEAVPRSGYPSGGYSSSQHQMKAVQLIPNSGSTGKITITLSPLIYSNY